MKKLILLVMLVFVVSGCTITKLDNNIKKNIDRIMNLNLKLSNNSKNGYKYYLPKGVSVTDNTDYNEKLVSASNTYYLYVDIVSEHYKSKLNYDVNDKAYLSLKLNYNDKDGYIEINKEKNLYLVEMVYNYAKIKAYAEYSELNDTIINMSYILSTISYNDKIISLIFDDSSLVTKEEKFALFKSVRKEGNFLDYINKYDKYVEEETQTQDTVDQPTDNNTE